MNVKRLLISGIIIWIVSTIFTWLTCGWLFNWVYLIPPVIWNDPATMFTTSSLILTNLFGLMIAILFTLVYAVLYKGIPNKGVKKGLTYGFLLWLVGALSGMITMPFYMTIAWTVIIYWIINAWVINLINGAIVGAIYKEKK
ncbi:MAG: hypothetical protein ABIG93_05955 [archaeon]|nr:hypothetical protein [Nanoarchaeota archaeon]